jgi:hypothetical protein
VLRRASSANVRKNVNMARTREKEKREGKEIAIKLR